MSSPAQAIATQQGSLLESLERLTPDYNKRVDELIIQLRDDLPQQTFQFEDAVRRYAVAKWRFEIHREMEVSFLNSIMLKELQDPETAALIEQYGERMVLGRAMSRDAEGPNVFAKIHRFETLVKKELELAKKEYQTELGEAYGRINRAAFAKAKPIEPQPEAGQTPRNALCPCGSGLKHKRCCAKPAPQVTQSAQAEPRT